MKKTCSEFSLFCETCFSVLVGFFLLLAGCATVEHSVIATTGTNIGIELSQNPENKWPILRIGYQRVEHAIVPTNRSAKKKPDESFGRGALDHGEVMMELRYGGLCCKEGYGGVYQRLAVGPLAVTHGSAEMMFAKDAKGEIPEQTLEAIKNLQKIPASTASIREVKNELMALKACHGDILDRLLEEHSLGTYDELMDKKTFTRTQIGAIKNILSSLNPCPSQ